MEEKLVESQPQAVGQVDAQMASTPNAPPSVVDVAPPPYQGPQHPPKYMDYIGDAAYAHMQYQPSKTTETYIVTVSLHDWLATRRTRRESVQLSGCT